VPPTAKGWALVVDDHPLFCDALELTLRSVTDFAEIRTADCLSSALCTMSTLEPPTLIVLDLNLPDVAGLDGLVRLSGQAPNTPIVVVSSMTENSVIHGALKAGAAGFVPKHSSRTVIRDAIDTVRMGAVYEPEGFVAPSDTEDMVEASVRLASLTNQQGRILGLICEGKLNKQIAYELSIAETTVKAHVTAIMRKLGVQSRTQAVLVAQSARLSEGLPNGVSAP